MTNKEKISASGLISYLPVETLDSIAESTLFQILAGKETDYIVPTHYTF